MSLRHAVAVSESPFTFEQQVQEHAGSVWEFSAKTYAMSYDRVNDYADQFESFLRALNGRVGTFLFSPPGRYRNSSGAIYGTSAQPKVNLGGQIGRYLGIKDLPVSTTNVFRAGDMVQIGQDLQARLYQILEDVTSDEAGLATLSLAPKIMTPYNDNDLITYNNPHGLWRLKDNYTTTVIEVPFRRSYEIRAMSAL